MRPKLSILMPVLRSRFESSERIIGQIRAQAKGKPVELLTEIDNGATPSGAKRAALLARASGDYIAYVDDDDEVAGDYVEQLLGGIACGVDVVTFQLEYCDLKTGRNTLWRFGLGCHDTREQPGRPRPMMANHLCAWRRWIAAAVPWSPIHYADDVFWYRPLNASGIAQNEVHVPKPLYRYLFNWSTTENQKRDRIEATKAWCGPGVDAYWLDDQIVIACENRRTNRGKQILDVRTVAGVMRVPVQRLRNIITVRV